MTTSPAPASACRRAARLVTLPSTLTLAESARRPTTAGPTATPAPMGSSTSAALSMIATAVLTAWSAWSTVCPETLKVAMTASPANLSTMPEWRPTSWAAQRCREPIRSASWAGADVPVISVKPRTSANSTLTIRSPVGPTSAVCVGGSTRETYAATSMPSLAAVSRASLPARRAPADSASAIVCSSSARACSVAPVLNWASARARLACHASRRNPSSRKDMTARARVRTASSNLPSASARRPRATSARRSGGSTSWLGIRLTNALSQSGSDPAASAMVSAGEPRSALEGSVSRMSANAAAGSPAARRVRTLAAVS